MGSGNVKQAGDAQNEKNRKQNALDRIEIETCQTSCTLPRASEINFYNRIDESFLMVPRIASIRKMLEDQSGREVFKHAIPVPFF